jgi:hypothetical protein
MDDRTRRLFAAALGVVIVVSAATVLLLGGNTPATPTSTPPPDAQQLVGVIVGVDAASLTDVRGFTLRTTDGGTVAFKLGALENGSQFPPGHLVEHQATAQPVRVWYLTDVSGKVAIRLEDAT